VDPTFPMSANDNEIRVLAGSVLAAAMNPQSEDLSAGVARAVLTASAGGQRKPSVRIDLVGMAELTISDEALRARQRPALGDFDWPDLATEGWLKAIETMKAQPQPAHIVAAVTEMTDVATGHFNRVRDQLVPMIRELRQLSKVQDEEIQVLWWLMGGWSRDSQEPFEAIPASARPLVVGKESADLVVIAVEPPALRAILSRAGISSEQTVTIPDAVNTCGDGRLERLKPPFAPCTTLTPIHAAVSRALETGVGPAWIDGWSAACGLPADTKINALDLAVQIHRERGMLRALN